MRILTTGEKQKTIAGEAVYKGIGLHTGSKCVLIMKPAPDDHGVTFVRTDLPGAPVLKADHRHVTSVIRGTTLSVEGDKDHQAKVHTVEHVLSALVCLGIDNMVIEVNANEPPVADGSAMPFIEAIRKAGIKELNAPRRFFQPDRLEYTAGETGTGYVVEPSENYEVDVTIDFNHPLIGRQNRVFSVDTDTYLREIASARTFCFDYEVEQLKRHGLARGGSLDNAIVVGSDRVHTKENKLRYPDEFVRHKTLDLIGDLFLLGMPIKAKVAASRVGHGYNVNLVKQLAAQLEALKASAAA